MLKCGSVDDRNDGIAVVLRLFGGQFFQVLEHLTVLYLRPYSFHIDFCEKSITSPSFFLFYAG